MNNEAYMRKRQMLESLEYIDDDLISGVLKKIKPELEIAEPVRTWRTPFKHWKQLVALAASLILLSLAFPFITRFVSNTIDFLAGRGGDNTDDTEGMYDEYILTEEDLAELNEAYFQLQLYFYEKDSYETTLDEEFLNGLRNSPYNKFALTVEAAMSRPTSKPHNGGRYYIGKYGDCIVYFHLASDMAILWPDFLLYVCYDSRFYKLETALENGWLSDYDVRMIQDFCNQIDYYNPN